MGQAGLDLGPYVHLLDECALADPLLARLPAVFNDAWRVGHYRRMIPAQYRESLERSANLLEDKALAEYYEHLRLITRSTPLLRGDRLRAILRVNRGAFDHLINRPYYRHAGTIVRLREMSLIKETGTAIGDQGVRTLDIALAIQCDEQPGRQQIDLSLDSDDTYALFFLKEGRLVGRLDMEPVPQHRRPAGLMRHTVALPAGATERGFDTIVVSGAAGDDPPAIGHLILR